jgi:hypothetical protein
MTIHLTLINLSGDIASMFIQNLEAFPHLEVMYTPSRVASAFALALESEEVGEDNLRLAMGICQRRGIELRGEAQQITFCTCRSSCELCKT